MALGTMNGMVESFDVDVVMWMIYDYENSMGGGIG